MPLDLSGVSKLFPDAQLGFKWIHKASGYVEQDSLYNIKTPHADGRADHEVSRTQGYSSDRLQDWRNVEVKTYFDGVTGSKSLMIHLGGNLAVGKVCPCCAFGYQAYFSSDGIIRIRKMTYYGNYDIMIEKDNGILPSGFNGVAFVRYNVHDDSQVVLETWTDKGMTGLWKRACRVIDTGNKYGKGGTTCGSREDRAQGTWGFPAITFGNKGFDYNYLNMTAREINASGSFNEAQYRSGIRRPLGGGGGTPLPGYVT